MLTVIDIETTYQGKWDTDTSDPTPYNTANKLVSVGYQTNTGEKGYLIFHHKEVNDRRLYQANVKQLQDVLSRSKLIIGHNLKFDMSWLFESGFTYGGRFYDTMIFEYINARGMKLPINLAATVERYKLPSKGDILKHYCGELGLNVDEVPLKELIEYGENDVDITWQLFVSQRELIKNDPQIASMRPAMRLMNDFLEVLTDVERNGIKIDVPALDAVEVDFKAQHAVLEQRLKEMIVEVMGHTPINLGSPEQVSWVLYSRRVPDKENWKLIFNLGSEDRNGVSKKKYVKKYDEAQLRTILKTHCTPVRKTKAEQCPDCNGTGRIQLLCKDGRNRKNLNVCHRCNKSGVLYVNLPEVAGFKLKPLGSEWASEGGFSSDKDTIEQLIEAGATGRAKEFLECLREYNAISTYLSSFVEGIRKNLRHDLLLHTNLNQCITATGRLSSTRPNLQNQPRESTFPIRRVFVSRFNGGGLLNADFKQLEFRVAAFLAQCANAMKDIADGVDVHRQTAAAIFSKSGDAVTKEERDDAKKSTFRPLYGGTSGTPAQLAYFKYFFSHYDGIFSWHNKLCEHAVAEGFIQTPSGRIYAFPFCARRKNGSVSYHTQIKNYPVQGFATGDILPVTMIEIFRLMKERNVRSKLCLTVHDSIVADCHPQEQDIMVQIFKEGFARTIPALKERFNIDFNISLDFDLDFGYNLLNKKKVSV